MLQSLGGLFDDAFSVSPHLGVLAGSVRALHERGVLPTAYAVRDEAGSRVPAGYVESLVADAPDPEAMEAVLASLVDEVKRSLAGAAAACISTALAGGAPIEQVLDRAAGQLQLAASAGCRLESAAEGADEMWAEFERREANPGAITGVPTGLPWIDHALGGLPRQEYTVLGARTSHGKSAIGGLVAMHAASLGIPVLVVGHEMPRIMYIRRLVAARAGVSYQCLERANLREPWRTRAAEARDWIRSAPIQFLCDPAMAGPAGIHAAAAWGARHRGGLVVLDYIQKEHIDGWRGQRTEELGMLCDMWGAVFRRHDLAGLVLSQINRMSMGRPRVTELADSSTIEKNAYAVLLLWRPAKEDKPPDDAVANQAELSLAKSRNGGLTRQMLHFSGYCIRFRPWAPSDAKLVTEDEANFFENGQIASMQAFVEEVPK